MPQRMATQPQALRSLCQVVPAISQRPGDQQQHVVFLDTAHGLRIDQVPRQGIAQTPTAARYSGACRPEQLAGEQPTCEQALAAVLADHGAPSVTTVTRLPWPSKLATMRGVAPSSPK